MSALQETLNQANSAFVDENYLESLQLYNSCVELLSKSSEASVLAKTGAYTSRAACLLKLSKYLEAVADCNEALRLDPANVKAFERKGIALFYSDEFEASADNFEKALQLDPTNASLKQWYTKAIASREPESSKQHVAPKEETVVTPASTAVANTNPDSAGNEEKEKGNAAFAKKDYKTAIVHYTNAIQLDTNNYVFYNNRSNAYTKLGDFTKALEDATKSIELNNKWSKSYYRQGDTLFNLKRYEEAVQAFSKGILVEKDPQLVNGLEEAQFFLHHNQQILQSPVLSKVTARQLVGTVKRSMEVLNTESFAKDITAITVNVGPKTIRCMRNVVIDKLGHIVSTKIPTSPAMMLTEEDRRLLDYLKDGKYCISTVYIHVDKDLQTQKFYIQPSDAMNKVPSCPCSPLQSDVLSLIAAEINRNSTFFNPYITSILFKQKKP